MMEEIIVVEKLNKSYQHKSTVHDLCFTVCQGEIVGLLGPNGAGKSTTINILSTILKPDSGNVSIGGYDLAKDKSKIKKFIGIVPQDLFKHHTASHSDWCHGICNKGRIWYRTGIFL